MGTGGETSTVRDLDGMQIRMAMSILIGTALLALGIMGSQGSALLAAMGIILACLFYARALYWSRKRLQARQMVRELVIVETERRRRESERRRAEKA